jgi:hypothetical protein
VIGLISASHLFIGQCAGKAAHALRPSNAEMMPMIKRMRLQPYLILQPAWVELAKPLASAAYTCSQGFRRIEGPTSHHVKSTIAVKQMIADRDVIFHNLWNMGCPVHGPA